jgi:hypothetical protein
MVLPDDDGWQNSAMAVQLMRKDPACLGIAPGPQSSPWIVWLSVFGHDIEILSGWTDRPKAAAALVRCIRACAFGSGRLLEQLENDRSADGFVPPAALTPAVVAELRGIAQGRIFGPRPERHVQ